MLESLQDYLKKNRDTLRTVVLENIGERFSPYADNCLRQLPRELTEFQLWAFKAHLKDSKMERNVEFSPYIPALTRLAHLEILVLTGFGIRPNEERFLQNLGNLRCLKIRNSFDIDDRDFMQLDVLCNCHNLEYLSLRHMKPASDHWVRDLVRNNPGLKHIYLRLCEFLDDCNQLANLPQLDKLGWLNCKSRSHELDLTRFSKLKEFTGSISDAGVVALLGGAGNLELLNVSEYWNWLPSALLDDFSRLSDEANRVASLREEEKNTRLYLIVPSESRDQWMRRHPGEISRLLSVETRCLWQQHFKNKIRDYHYHYNFDDDYKYNI